VLADPTAARVTSQRQARAPAGRSRRTRLVARQAGDLARRRQDRLLANIELSEDATHAAELGAEGVGLYRTEFLYMNRRSLPTEEEQYRPMRAWWLR